MLVEKSLHEAKTILEKFITDKQNIFVIENMIKAIVGAYRAGNKVLICGNGGSMADAMHFAEELTGRFRNDRDPLPALALADPSHITCVANDYGFEKIFSRSVKAFGEEGDIFIGLSTSGNSGNIIAALDMAEKKKLTTFLFLGKNGGKLKDRADHQLIVNGRYSDRIQEIHMLVLHILVEGIEKELFNQ